MCRSTHFIILDYNLRFFAQQNLAYQLTSTIMQGGFELSISGVYRAPLVYQILSQDIIALLGRNMQSVPFKIVHSAKQLFPIFPS